MDAVQSMQSEQYGFPYHYLAGLSYDGKDFRSSRSWEFSLSYVTALHHVSSAISDLKSCSHLDIGCGDGALLYLLRQRHPDIRLAGIDYDAKAIGWAKMFSPSETFYRGNLAEADVGTNWDTASLIEVLEHIPPDSLPHFTAGVRGKIRKDGRLIVTVPHENKPISTKHYQHFSFRKLTHVLEAHFDLEFIFGFEFFPVAEIIYRRLFSRPNFYLESMVINRIRLRYQLRRKESVAKRCGRIFAIFRAK